MHNSKKRCIFAAQIDMNNILKNYENQKIKEVILYILSQKGVISYFELMKIMFCAERRNLIKWGDPVTSLQYYARKHGPVPLSVYYKIKQEKKGEASDLSDTLSMVDEFKVKANRLPNMDYISVSDKESIDYAIKELSGMDYKEIESYLHESVYERIYATYRKHYSHTDMALTDGASKQALSLINENDNIAKALS